MSKDGNPPMASCKMIKWIPSLNITFAPPFGVAATCRHHCTSLATLCWPGIRSLSDPDTQKTHTKLPSLWPSFSLCLEKSFPKYLCDIVPSIPFISAPQKGRLKKKILPYINNSPNPPHLMLVHFICPWVGNRCKYPLIYILSVSSSGMKAQWSCLFIKFRIQQALHKYWKNDRQK